MQTYSGISIHDYAAVKSSDLQRKVGTVLKRIAVGKERLIVEREGYPVAVMLPYPDFEELIHDRTGRQMKAFLEGAGGDEFSEKEVEDDIQKAVNQVRHNNRRKK